jgi:hypothetical protein
MSASVLLVKRMNVALILVLTAANASTAPTRTTAPVGAVFKASTATMPACAILLRTLEERASTGTLWMKLSRVSS